MAEYAKQEKITDQGARKRVASELVQSVQLDGNTFILIEDTSKQAIKDLKAKIRLLNSKMRTLKAEALAVDRQADYVIRLEQRVDDLEQRLDASTDKKEELYEKILSTKFSLLSE